MQQPELYKHRRISPIWFLPFLALCISGWLLYTSYQDAGIDISIHFTTADGITPGKTKVIYKGIPVGTVTDVSLDHELSGVILQVEMDKKTKPGLMVDTEFWIVKPEISAGRVSGLETLLSGSYIRLHKGQSTTPCRTFQGRKSPPPVNRDLPGLHLTLKAEKLYSLQRGSHIYNKNLQIGIVDDYRLNTDDNTISVEIFIKPEFSHLIHEGTRFWNSSGLSITGGFQSGLTVNVESVATLIYGGLSCDTPKPLLDSPAATNGQTYPLYKDFEDARFGIPIALQLASGEGIVAGKTKVMFRGLKAGIVRSLTLNKDTVHTVTANILLDPRAQGILRENTRFWVIRPQVSLEGIKHLNTLVSGPYITFQVGDGEPRDHFIVESSIMPKPFLPPGRRFILQSGSTGSLKVGTPVLYKNREVGEVTALHFTDNGKDVQTEILIYERHAHLVRKDAVFWNISGIQVNGSLADFTINLASMRTIISGGITFSNPLSDRDQTPKPAAESGSSFPLYNSWSDAGKHVPTLRQPGKLINLQVKTMSPVSVGAPVLFKKIKVGEVVEFKLADQGKHIIGTILLYEKFTHLTNTTTRFYNASGASLDASLHGVSLQIQSLDSLIAGGISFFTPGKGSPIKAGTLYPLYTSREEALLADAQTLTLQFSNGTDITTRTEIKYQGVAIGRLTRIWFDPDRKTVWANATVKKNVARLFRDDSTLWLVKPGVDLSGVKNFTTILSGAFIALRPGRGKPATTFTVLDDRPSVLGPFPGLNLILEAPRLGSLHIGRPVYYRQIRIGEIVGAELGPTAQNVWIHINITPKYTSLVHKGSRFWNASGISLKGGLFSGLVLKTDSVETILTGGIAMATPEGEDMGEAAQNGNHFLLAQQPEDAWLTWSPLIKIHTPGQTPPQNSTLQPQAADQSARRISSEPDKTTPR